jgi:Zn-dependent membrane protease YugP
LVVIIGILLVLAAVFGPSLWVRWALARHGNPRPDFPGTGGEFARHLLDEGGLAEIRVEITREGDHYSPDEKAVRLSPEYHDGTSLTAVVVAAHEVGHAFQDRDGYMPWSARTRLVKALYPVQRIGAAVAMVGPVLGAATGSPVIGLMTLGAGILTMASAVVVHLVTLPVEFDASFARALPILDRGGYIPKRDLRAARSILRACALTYVAGALASLLNLWRWIRFLR